MSEDSTMAAPTKSPTGRKPGPKAKPAAASKTATRAAPPVAKRKAAAPQVKPVEKIVPAPVATELTVPAVVKPIEPVEIAAAIAPAAPIIQKEAEIMEDTVKKTAAKAETLFAEMNDRAKSAMEKSSKMVEQMNDFAKGNIEAVVESSKIAARGFETIGQDAAEYSRKSFEGATAAMKQFAGVKSPTELFKLQSDYMRSAFDSLVAETSKNTEAMLKLAGDVAQPLSNRASVAAEKIKIAA
jgi:phasin family protein